MILYTIKASCSFIRAGSFFLALVFLSNVVSGAEVTRSLSLEDRVRILEQQLLSANRMRAESQFEITNLKNEVRELRGLVEEQGYQLGQIVNRQREMYRDIDQRMGQPATAADTAGSQANTTTPVQQPPAQAMPPATSNPLDEDQVRSLYDKIFPLVRSKRYDDAIAGYQQFIAQYPDSRYVANSRYWLAQIYSVQGRIDEAEREYLSVAQQHATSAKAPDAWLKLGQLYERQGQTDKALDAYNQLVTQYSTSTAAQMAVNRLQDLKTGN